MTTERHETVSTAVVPSYVLDSRSQLECVALSGMVNQQRLSEEPTPSTSSDNEVRIEEWSGDVEEGSSIHSENEYDDDDDLSTDGGREVAVPDDGGNASYGNIVVKNSSDVQFGNNTYYQGPVTIKQFVYKGSTENGVLPIEDGAKTNLGFEVDVDIPSDCVKSDKDTNIADKNANIVTDSATPRIGGKWIAYLQRNSSIFTCCLSVVLVVSIILLTVILIKKNQIDLYPFPDDNQEEDNIPVGSQEPNVNVTLSGKLRIVPRLDWLAQPATAEPTPLKTPVPYVIILHTATDFCYDQAQCTHLVRYIQMFHIESKNWWDIGYNFLVGGDGLAYEGRGWRKEGANAFGYNAKSIGIAFIGTFNLTMPPTKQIVAAQKLIEMGVKKNYINSNYKLLAHRQLSPTQSPGEALFQNMKTWPHWVESP